MSHSRMIVSPIKNWASTSRQFCGNFSKSILPERTPFWRATISSKSCEEVGRNLALGRPPTWCPALPILCRAVAIEPGEPTWMTRSTDPISIPISRLDEETTHLSMPSLSCCSTSSRIDLSIDPWCPSTPSNPATLRRWTNVSVIFLVFTKTRVVVWDSTSSLIRSILWSRISLTGIDVNLGVGKMMSRSSFLDPEIFAIETRWAFSSSSLESLATRNSATSFRGSIVALIPILWTSDSTTESINARLNERWVPLLVGTRECNSSTISHFRSFNRGRNLLDANASPRDSGVVIRICGGFLSILSRSFWGVSPVLSPTLMSWALPGRNLSLISFSGPIRFFWMSFASAFIGEI